MKSRRMRSRDHVARMGQMKNEYEVFVVKPEWKKSLGRPRRKWEDNIGKDIRLGIGNSGRSSEHSNEPSGFIKGGEFLDYLSDY